MNKLLILRGCPCSGKSTWIKEMNLESYTLSPDTFRKIWFEGKKTPEIDEFIWEMIYVILEVRLKHNLLTVIDSTCDKIEYIRYYKRLCRKYKFEPILVDFANVNINDCLAKNEARNGRKRIPDGVIELVYNRIQEMKINHKIKIKQPSEITREELF